VTPAAQVVHASCVALNGRAVLIMGPSGSGKSALAMTLIAHGADLVADDRTEIFLSEGRLLARCPPALSGLIEARGVGILTATPLPQAEVALAADLGQAEPDRLPPRRSLTLLGQPIDLVLGQGNAHFPWAVLCYLKGSRHA
jgi:HPr kinase/phosphorylase